MRKDNSTHLQHKGEICFKDSSKKSVFVLATLYWTLEQPFGAYIKVYNQQQTGTGTTGEVRMAFRIQDLHPVVFKPINEETTMIL